MDMYYIHIQVLIYTCIIYIYKYYIHVLYTYTSIYMYYIHIQVLCTYIIYIYKYHVHVLYTCIIYIYKYYIHVHVYKCLYLVATGYRNTVEPPFNGQFGDFYFVLYTEVSFTRRFSSSGTGNANLRLYKTQNCFREDVLRNPQM